MSLSPEQEQTLQDLIAHLPRPALQAQPGSLDGILGTWLGVSQADLNTGWQSLSERRTELENRAIAWAEKRPLDAAFEFLGAASLAFYMVEKGINPKIDTYIDAFYYISTCASVGYADIFPATHTGRAIASLVMVVGPALAAKALDREQHS